MIPTPWSLGSERSGEFAQANLVREKPGPPSNWVGDFRFPSQLDAGAGARTRRSRPTKRTHRDHPGLEHFSVVTLPFAFLAFPCALAGVLSPLRGLLFSRVAAHGLRPFDKLRAGFHGWGQLQKPDTKKANVRKCHLEACFGMRQEEAKTRRGEEKGRIAVKKPEDRRNRFPVRFRRSEGTQVFPPVAKGLPSRDFCGLIRSQFRGLFHSFQ